MEFLNVVNSYSKNLILNYFKYTFGSYSHQHNIKESFMLVQSEKNYKTFDFSLLLVFVFLPPHPTPPFIMLVSLHLFSSTEKIKDIFLNIHLKSTYSSHLPILSG